MKRKINPNIKSDFNETRALEIEIDLSRRVKRVKIKIPGHWRWPLVMVVTLVVFAYVVFA